MKGRYHRKASIWYENQHTIRLAWKNNENGNNEHCTTYEQEDFCGILGEHAGKFIWKWLENQIECLSTTALQIFLILRTIHKKLKKRKEFNYNPFIGLWKMFMMKEWECYLRWKKKVWKNDDVKNDWILKFARHFSIFHTTSIKYLRNFSQLLLRQFPSTKSLLKNSSQFLA